MKWTTTATPIGSDTGSTAGMCNTWVVVDEGTGGYRPRDYYSPWITVSQSTSNVEPEPRIEGSVTKKDLKMIKDEVKKYMTAQMKKDVAKAAGKLFTDIEKLKKDKTQLKRGITELKSQLKQAKEDMRVEMAAWEEMIAQKTNEIMRFGMMDFSK